MSLLRPELSKEHEHVFYLNMMLFCGVLSVNLITFGSAVLTQSCNVDHVSKKELIMTWRLIRFQNSSFWRLVSQTILAKLSFMVRVRSRYFCDWLAYSDQHMLCSVLGQSYSTVWFWGNKWNFLWLIVCPTNKR